MEGALYTASVELAFLLRDARIYEASGQDTLMLRRPDILQKFRQRVKVDTGAKYFNCMHVFMYV